MKEDAKWEPDCADDSYVHGACACSPDEASSAQLVFNFSRSM